MDFKIKKIFPSELQSFLDSSEYQSMRHLPLSPLRILSYQKNPRKIENKPALYLGYWGEELISYRSVLQDWFFDERDQPIGFFWPSGSWTHPEYRRKGFSQKVLDEVMADYEERVFVTNYSEMSRALYSSRKELTPFPALLGMRFYYKMPLAEVLPPRRKIYQNLKPLLSFVDVVGNAFWDLLPRNKGRKIFPNIEAAALDLELEEFLKNQTRDSLFRRSAEELRWVLKYPWVKEEQEETAMSQKYNFTSSAVRFRQYLNMIKNEGKISGFLFFTVFKDRLEVQYVFVNTKEDLGEFGDYLLNFIRQEKISVVVLTDSDLIQYLTEKRGFIYKKIWRKGFFVGKKILKNHPEITGKKVFMGDGDTVFV